MCGGGARRLFLNTAQCIRASLVNIKTSKTIPKSSRDWTHKRSMHTQATLIPHRQWGGVARCSVTTAAPMRPSRKTRSNPSALPQRLGLLPPSHGRLRSSLLARRVGLLPPSHGASLSAVGRRRRSKRPLARHARGQARRALARAAAGSAAWPRASRARPAPPTVRPAACARAGW